MVSGANSVTMAPLISVSTIFDLDYGLIRLIEKEYMDTRVFDPNYFERNDKLDIIKDLYYRPFKNPLYCIAKPNIEREELDEYYVEFLESCRNDILDNSVSTEMLNVIALFNTNNEIHTSVLYYDDYQKEALLEEDEINNIPLISLQQLSSYSKRNSFSQYYFRSIEELKPFLKCDSKTFYIANMPINLNEEQDDIVDHPYIKEILFMNHINIFNIYNEIILNGDDEEEEEEEDDDENI